MIYFDIETLGCNDPVLIAELEKTISAPAQYKKTESIDEWMVLNKSTELQKLVSKTSFDGMYGRIACIAWASNDWDVISTQADMTEEESIECFYQFVEASCDNKFCGHNLHGFDLPFLKHRSIILGIKPPRFLLEAMNAKAWDNCIQDTMILWSQDRDKRASMSKLCKVLGIEDKGDMDGSKVAETWVTDPDKVIDYCKADVERTRQIYKRLTFNL
ncbi:MAG: ribonuclease H-like domain-containing protein [Nitrosomonas sp.]|nr:ribonuclease H-like domain-containing protein [Nitrosomonas sp.]